MQIPAFPFASLARHDHRRFTPRRLPTRRTRLWHILIIGLALLWPAFTAGAADPAYYVRKPTWQETMLASLHALDALPLSDGFTPVETETLRGGQSPQHIVVELSGARELYLFATGVPDAKWGVGDWADAKLIARDGKETPLTKIRGYDALAGRIEEDLTLRSGLYQKMRLAGRQFDRGINVQADSVVHVPLEGRYVRFEAWVGVDDWAGANGTVRFSVAGARSGARKRLFDLVARDFPQKTPRQQIGWEREDGSSSSTGAPVTGLSSRAAMPTLRGACQRCRRQRHGSPRTRAMPAGCRRFATSIMNRDDSRPRSSRRGVSISRHCGWHWKISSGLSRESFRPATVGSSTKTKPHCGRRWLASSLRRPAPQWKYACRAGSDTPLDYGGVDTDFARFANLADINLRRLADEGWRPKAPDLVPRDGRFNDGALVTVDVGHYQPNSWGLHDMHGNAAEWTRTTYKPYLYNGDDGRDRISTEGEKVVRGGSWRDRPKFSRSAYRWSYPSYQKVYNVGFRVVIESGPLRVAAAGPVPR